MGKKSILTYREKNTQKQKRITEIIPSLLPFVKYWDLKHGHAYASPLTSCSSNSLATLKVNQCTFNSFSCGKSLKTRRGSDLQVIYCVRNKGDSIMILYKANDKLLIC